ncbi:ATP synthase I subunit [Planifilum fimeticola]|uniref:ATP synthase I subunit n=1 Tax=Planifilum fimeticola TaxID=201975 RepID=A0A2T0LHX8_9BACL|nr:ATP synthase subunit I [Planifilum fimeticola]PRX42024.1 ATP synthase I subunit [Planifilum fimeticola]
MEALRIRQRRVTILTFVVLALFFLLWLTTPMKAVFAGLLLGGLASLYNVLHLARRIRLVRESIRTGSGRVGTGLGNRLIMAAAAVIIAAKYPDFFNLAAVGLGLGLSYVQVVIVEVWILTQSSSSQGKG